MNTQDLSDFQGRFSARQVASEYVENLIGNTPLLAIHCHFNGQRRTIFAKAEHLNLTGSIKDRMAFHILKCAYRDGSIRPGDTIAEATSGNTGISFAAIGRSFGNPVHVFMPDWMSRERIALIKSFGAQVTLVSRDQGGFLGSIELADGYCPGHGRAFLPHQFSNLSNAEAHYLTTGPEIYSQLKRLGFEAEAFVAGVGTGGTVMGVGAYLKEQNPDVKIYPLEPSESPTLSTGHKIGNHRIQGISDEFIPPICDPGKLDEVISVSDGDSILMAQKLAADLGLGVGISSGANFLGALIATERLGSDAIVATVFPDDNKKYLSTDLITEQLALKDYLSPHVRLFGYQTIPRCDIAGAAGIH